MNPEEKAREQIDAMLTSSGWIIQNYRALNLSAGCGIALREVPLKSGPRDYVAEQTRTVAEVERRLSVVEELEAVVSDSLQRAMRWRRSILQKAFTGKLLTADGAHNTDKK